MSFELTWNTQEFPEKPYWERKRGGGQTKYNNRRETFRFTGFSRIKLLKRHTWFPSKVCIFNHWILLLLFLWGSASIMWLRLSLNIVPMIVPIQLPEYRKNICVLLCLALTGSFSYLWVSENFSEKSLDTSNFQRNPAEGVLKQHALS